MQQAGGEPGDIKFIGHAAIPSGWLACDGAAVSRATYGNLFSKVGTTWGAGDGSTTFNLPDMRGRSPIGSGTGGGLSARSVGQVGGAEVHALSSGEMPSHDHRQRQSINANGFEDAWVGNTTGGSSRAMTTGSSGFQSTAVFVAASGGSGAHNNMQPYAVCNFVIKT